MACVAVLPSVDDLEGRMRREGEERDECMRAEMESFKDMMEQKLLIETERRHKAERTAEQFATQFQALTSQMSSAGLSDTLAQAPKPREVTAESLHMAAPSAEEEDNVLNNNLNTAVDDQGDRKYTDDAGGTYARVMHHGAYMSLDLMSTEVLHTDDMKFEYKELAEDMWGIAVMLVTRDLPEMCAGIDGSNLGRHLIRFVYATVCVFLNLFLQLAMLWFVSSYIVGSSVWTIQGQYAQFHKDIFNKDGEFQEDKWVSWDGPRDELCDAVINKKVFLGCILFLWIGRMLGEFKSCQRMSKELWALPSAPPGVFPSQCMLTRAKTGDVEVIAMTKGTRFAIYVFVVIPRVFVCVLLGTLGCQWLTATLSFSDLILNALALEFIVNIDENILNFFLPARIKVRLGGTKLAYPSKNANTAEQSDQLAIDDYVRNITYFTLCLTVTAVWVLYLQQVLPWQQLEIEPHCGKWYQNQFTAKCTLFEGGCFPYGDTKPPHDYAELAPK